VREVNQVQETVMKFAIVFALAGFVLAQTFAAPSVEPQVEAVESNDDSLVSTDTTSSLVEANEAIEDSNRAKKSPKTICFETQDVQGRSFLQCAESADSEVEGTHLSYSSAPAPSYGSSSYGSSSGYSAPSYKVNLKTAKEF
jgi:hypothetical protein